MGDSWHALEGPIPEGDPREQILVWHRYNGVMVCARGTAHLNRFFTHWRRADVVWRTMDVPPAKEDADVLNCVLYRRTWGEILVKGWWQAPEALHIDRWARCPPEPGKEG